MSKIKYDPILGALRQADSAAPINLTLAELQALQFTDAPAPTGITITPDAVGDNPRSWNFKIAGYNRSDDVTLVSEAIEVIVGDDTSSFLIDALSTVPSILVYVDSGNGYIHFQIVDIVNLPSQLNRNLQNNPWDEAPIDEFLSGYPITQQKIELPVGQQYYVTDKDWLLYVDTPMVLKPVSGSLHLFNGQELPAGIEPDVLLIDTGIVDWDIAPGPNELSILRPYNFIPSILTIEQINGFGNNIIFNITCFPFIEDSIIGGIKSMFFASRSDLSIDIEIPIVISMLNVSELNSFRFILEFHRSELSYPIPVPHIISAETSVGGNYVDIVVDCDLNGFQALEGCMVLRNAQNIADMQYVESSRLIRIELSQSVLFGDHIKFSVSSGVIKNIWGGVLPEVVDYPVVNNVPAP